MIKYQGSVALNLLCEWAGIARSSFYYKTRNGKRGIKPSTHTLIGDQGVVENELVVEQIRAILSLDYCIYGYHKMTDELRDMEYQINDKKVYRLMKEHYLLSGKRIKTQGKRTFVKYRRIEAKRPMEHLCLDIKYVWVTGEKRWYYQLAIIDVYSRRILCWIFQQSIRQNDVIALMRLLDLRYGLKGVIIRNDNGSQFIASKLRAALIDLEAKQEFTHVATPEENAYIEAFHSIQQSELMDRFDFSSYYDAKQHIEKYMHWYNYQRKHGAIGMMTPVQKWEQGWAWLTVKQQFEPDSFNLSRSDNGKAMSEASASYNLEKFNESGYLRLTGNQEIQSLVVNRFQKSVQTIGG